MRCHHLGANSHLIVVGKVEVSAEPGLDLGVGADGVDVALGGHGVVVVQPAAAVDDVALLSSQIVFRTQLTGTTPTKGIEQRICETRESCDVTSFLLMPHAQVVLDGLNVPPSDLQDAKARSDDGGVGEAEDGPSILI